MRYDPNHVKHTNLCVLHSLGHISLNCYPICLILGSFLRTLVGENYIQVIITGFDQDRSRPVFCGFLRFCAVQSGLLRSWDMDGPVLVSVHQFGTSRPDWTGLSSTIHLCFKHGGGWWQAESVGKPLHSHFKQQRRLVAGRECR